MLARNNEIIKDIRKHVGAMKALIVQYFLQFHFNDLDLSSNAHVT